MILYLYRTLRTAFRALRRNVMRSVLTTLGIIIGVAAVIAMMELGHGVSSQIQKSIASMGANTLLVLPGTATANGITFGSGSTMNLTPKDCEAIRQECPAVLEAAPAVWARLQAVYGNHNWVPLTLCGTTPAFFTVRDWNTDQGQPFTDQDVRGAAKVCVIGQTLVRELFQGENPIGQEMRLQNVSLKVVGVLSRKGANMSGSDQDDIVLVPWTTLKYRLVGTMISTQNQSAAAAATTGGVVNTSTQLYPQPGDNEALYPAASAVEQTDTPMPVRFSSVSMILVSAKSARAIPQAIRQVTALLRERHRIHDDKPEDFTIRNMTEILALASGTTRLMINLLLAVALISLVVGGVGIMNIMLVSVTERTREIGLRMAVGARARDILLQFLVEAVVLCLAGGAVGIIAGRGSSMLIRYFAKWPTEISIAAIVSAVAVSASVGVIFGYYPAWKASRLDPIEALRYE